MKAFLHLNRWTRGTLTVALTVALCSDPSALRAGQEGVSGDAERLVHFDAERLVITFPSKPTLEAGDDVLHGFRTTYRRYSLTGRQGAYWAVVRWQLASALSDSEADKLFDALSTQVVARARAGDYRTRSCSAGAWQCTDVIALVDSCPALLVRARTLKSDRSVIQIQALKPVNYDETHLDTAGWNLETAFVGVFPVNEQPPN